MHDTFTSDNARDWQSRYGGTFGFLLKEDRRVLVQFSDQSDEYVYFKTDFEGMNYHVRINSDVKFEFIQVDNAWFNSKSGSVYLLNRVPARQWRRGICKHNTNAVELLQNGYTTQAAIGFKLLNDIYHTTTPDYQCNGPVTKPRALSRAFAIGNKHLYFYDQVVGTVENGVITLTGQGELIRQELSDVLRRNGYDKYLTFGVN